MADSRIVVANGVYDLSEVKTTQHLKEEIELLKASIKNDEEGLKIHFRKAPQEVLKSTADAVLPSFINTMIANRSWKILTSGIGLLANPFSKKLSIGKNILGGAKKLGMLTAVRGAYNLWKNKNSDKPITKVIKPVASRTITPLIKPVKQ